MSRVQKDTSRIKINNRYGTESLSKKKKQREKIQGNENKKNDNKLGDVSVLGK